MARAYTRALLLFMTSVVAVAPAQGQSIATNPDDGPLMVEDILRLADVLRFLEPGSDKLDVLEQNYLARASPGLRVYAERYDLTPARLASALEDRPEAYANLDTLASAMLAQEPALRSGFSQLLTLFPEAAFPPVWFVVGHHGPGGLTRREGVIVAAERYAGQADGVVPLVLHELTHFQQAMVQGVERYQEIYGPDQTLLALALREGTAELVAELTTGEHINPAAEHYGLEHEEELWQQFREDMHDRDPGEWMFVQPSDDERPPDLGYWMGYRIAKRYYDHAEDKQQAIYVLLDAQDYAPILEESGYAEQFED